MFLNLVRTEKGLIPIDDKSVEAIKKLKVGDEIFAEYKPRRNYKFHKKFYSMVNLIKNNQDLGLTLEDIVTECKLDAGYYDTYEYKGEKLKIPKSIAFHSMDNEEFGDFYSSAIDTCLGFVPMGRTELEDAVLRYC